MPTLPLPHVDTLAVMRRARRSLTALAGEYPDGFRRLFHHSQRAHLTAEKVSGLEECGLVVAVGDHTYTSPFRISQVGRQFIVTDSLKCSAPHRVFPVSADESIYLARVARRLSTANDRVLDIGTGSGILGLVAKPRVKRAMLSDINPRALFFARFNAHLNGVVDSVDVRPGHLFDSAGREPFDLIVCNPPVIPTPPESNFFLHSDGGPDGMAISLPLLKGVAGRLSRRGHLAMLATSFVDKKGRYALVDALRKDGAMPPLHLSIRRLYRRSLHPLSRLAERYPMRFSSLTSMENQGMVALDYLLILARRSAAFAVSDDSRVAAIPVDRSNGSWSARLNRLFSAYRNKPEYADDYYS